MHLEVRDADIKTDFFLWKNLCMRGVIKHHWPQHEQEDLQSCWWVTSSSSRWIEGLVNHLVGGKNIPMEYVKKNKQKQKHVLMSIAQKCQVLNSVRRQKGPTLLSSLMKSLWKHCKMSRIKLFYYLLTNNITFPSGFKVFHASSSLLKGIQTGGPHRNLLPLTILTDKMDPGNKLNQYCYLSMCYLYGSYLFMKFLQVVKINSTTNMRQKKTRRAIQCVYDIDI